MSIGGSLISAAPALNKMGSGTRQRIEGPGSYDPNTGKYYDPSKVERNMVVGSMFNPAKAWADPNLTTGEKVMMTLTSGFGGNLIKGKYRKRLEARNKEMADMYAGISNKIEGLPDYEVAPEAYQQLETLQGAGERMTDLAGEATDIAQSRVGEEAPGSGIVREDIKQATAQQIESAQMQGGDNAMSAIASIGDNEQSALRQLAKENIAYKSQAQADLQKAMLSEGMIGAEAAQMEAAGLGTIVSEKGKQYQSKLDKSLTGIDFDMNKLSMEQLGYQAQQEARAATQSAAMSAFSQIGSSWLANRSANKSVNTGGSDA